MSDAAPGERRPVYVVDAHALYWYLEDPARLGQGAVAALDLAAAGGAQAIVPAIVVAETYYTSVKLRRPLPPGEIIGVLGRTPGYTFSPLGRQQLGLLDQLTAVPEMHDRLIVADALVHHAVLITRDAIIQRSGLVPTLW